MNSHDSDSQLFTVRLWPASRPGAAWRGRVTHVLSGETRYFREWPVLVAFLDELFRSDEGDRTAHDENETGPEEKSELTP